MSPTPVHPPYTKFVLLWAMHTPGTRPVSSILPNPSGPSGSAARPSPSHASSIFHTGRTPAFVTTDPFNPRTHPISDSMKCCTPPIPTKQSLSDPHLSLFLPPILQNFRSDPQLSLLPCRNAMAALFWSMIAITRRYSIGHHRPPDLDCGRKAIHALQHRQILSAPAASGIRALVLLQACQMVWEMVWEVVWEVA